MSKKLYIFIFLLILVIASIALIFFGFGIGQQQLTLDNQVDGLTIEFVDKNALLNILKEYKAVGSGRAKAIKLTISTNELPNPTFIQLDKDGNTVIASAINISDRGTAEVEISLGDFVISDTKDNISSWLDSEFIEVANQLSKWNLAAKDEFNYYREIKPFSVFVVKKL